MSAIESHTIHQMTINLARNLLQVWTQREHVPPPTFATPEKLATVLEPGVAAFLGRLMTLTPEQEDTLPEIVARYFADPATAAALARFLSEPDATPDELAERLYQSGLAPNSALIYYFDQALTMLVAAANAAAGAAAQETAGEDNASSAPLFPLPPSLYISDYMLDDLKQFVAAMAEQGLDRVEMGRAVAADGHTDIFHWGSVLMSAAPPDVQEAIAPEETTGGAPAGEVGNGSGVSEVERPEPVPANGGSSQPPPPTVPGVVGLRLDAALPERVTIGHAFDLAVAVKRPESPALAPDDLARRESAEFAAVWPDNAAFIQLQIQVSAPDCLIHNGDTRPVRLFAGQDGPPVYFQLTPQRAGPLSVIITVYQEMDWVGSTRLRTEAGPGEPRGEIAIAVNSLPLSAPEVSQQALWKAISEGYNESELRDLCFELNIDYEELPGETKSAKARELVMHAKRRGEIAVLVGRVLAQRPHLLAVA